MAPDVQMHLSFPKRSSSHSKKIDKSTHAQRSIDLAKDAEPELDSNSNYNDTDSQNFNTKAAILPPPTPQSIKLNPKRSLTKNYLNAGTVWINENEARKSNRKDLHLDDFFLLLLRPWHQLRLLKELQNPHMFHLKLK